MYIIKFNTIKVKVFVNENFTEFINMWRNLN